MATDSEEKSDEMIRCQLCTEEVRKDRLRDHISSEHFNHARHKCQTCEGLSFNSMEMACEHAGDTGHVVNLNGVNAGDTRDRMIEMNYSFCVEAKKSDGGGDAGREKERKREESEPVPTTSTSLSDCPVAGCSWRNKSGQVNTLLNHIGKKHDGIKKLNDNETERLQQIKRTLQQHTGDDEVPDVTASLPQHTSDDEVPDVTTPPPQHMSDDEVPDVTTPPPQHTSDDEVPDVTTPPPQHTSDDEVPDEPTV